ncbi:TonB-dependent siderophore receptor [Flavobacterium algicola]|uniref:TonB-dependent siderophore receptor n=1 Tax=Flavobacterium algicola TaxID=556529 RepID=UPI001EFCAF71|nr:TonB-dependent siderophore receptor [Flavobacterium algicola]MCG9792530.1 TonB-dependent siderophore receptor [Flavobacterium algicola]
MKSNVLFLLASFAALSAQAQDLAYHTTTPKPTEKFYTEHDTVKNKKGESLREVTVTANKQPKPVTIIRSGIKVMDIPQSVQIIDSEIIGQQQAIRLSDVIKNANGVYVGSARGGAQESFWSRGYDMSSNNMFKNGFRYSAGSIPEVSSLERVEFLKGSSALLYGNVAPGGILNLVTKQPQFTKGGEISMQAGSYAFYKPTIDFYGPLNKSIAYRFTGSYENSESFRDVVKNERTYINPSFLFNVTDKTQITVQGDYLNADWTPDFGTGVIGKEILDLPRSSFYGALWSTGNTKSASASVLLNHDFNKNWKLNFNTSYQNYDRESKSTAQLSGLNTYATRGDWKRGLTQSDNEERIFGNQFSLQGTFNTGSIKHQIFTGVDYDNAVTKAYTFAFFDAAGNTKTTEDTAINLFTYDPSTQSTVIPFDSRATQIVNTDSQRFGAYFQDLISLTDKVKVLAGIRWSWIESEASTYKETLVNKFQTVAPENNTPTIAPKTLDNAFSPKVGLVYQPTKDITIFSSYANSFTPNNSNTTVDLQPLAPSIIDQYEAGIKTDFWRGILSTNVTVYQITNNNLVQTAQFKADGSANTDTTLKVLSGETKSKGVEVDITARPIEGLNINAGYSYNDMRFVKTPVAVGNSIEGDRVARTPANTANLSFFYTVQSGALKGLAVGAIGNYIGNRIAGWNNRYIADTANPGTLIIEDREVPVDGYTTVDVSVGYTWKKLSLLCKLSNITDELNYTVHENYSVNPIAPRQVLTSLKYKF